MAVYRFSALADGQAISFDPDADVLNFDQTAIAAADVRAAAEGSNLRVSAADKDILLLGISPFEISTSNVTFADGSRLLFGDDSANSLIGTGGRDHLAGLGGADTLNGGAGNDVYFVTAGDVITDSGGIDTIFAQTSFALPSPIENIVYLGSANTASVGNSLGNAMTGNGGNNYLEGRGGNDTLAGGAGTDTLVGGAGNDLFRLLDATPDSITDFTSSADKIHLDASFFTALGGAGTFADADARFRYGSSAQDADDRVIYNASTGQLWYDADGNGSGAAQLIANLTNRPALAAADIAVDGEGGGTPPGGGVIRGTSGNDSLVGTAGNDSMEGLAGNDTLNGGAGADTMDGGLHSDVFIVDNIGDVVIELEGGGADDEVRSSVSYTTPSWVNHLTLIGTAAIDGIGNELPNILTGNGANNTLVGGAGVDTLAGGAGLDSIVFAAAPSSANADLVNGFLSGQDKLVIDGGFHANAGANGSFSSGDARFFAGAGASSGQDATDRVVYNTSTGELWYDADGSGAGAAQLVATLQGAPALAATDIAVINGSGAGAGVHLIGTTSNDSLVGGAGNDTLEGLGGADTLRGNAGDDTLDGGADFDTMDGGQGNDTYFVTAFADAFNAGDVLVDAGGIDTAIAEGGTLPAGIENLLLRPTFFETGGTGNSLGNLIRNETANTAFIDGAGGNDTLLGGTGFDFFSISDGNDSVDGRGGGDWLSGGSIDFRTGTATNGTGTTVFTNIATGQGSSSNDRLTADDGGRRLHGEAGDDTVAGGAGDDELLGDGGFDHPDTLVGNDVMTGGGGNDFLAGGAGNDTLDGGTGNDTLRGAGDGDDGADRFQFSVAPGAANADQIGDFGSGADKIVLDGSAHANSGASGNFTAGDGRFFAGAGANAGHDATDRVVYNTSTGQLWYDADGSGGGSAQLIATLDGAPALVATDLTLVNGSGSSEPPPGVITGTSGNDSLTGSSGDDTIDGGAGTDTMNGGLGNDTYFVTAGDVVQDSGGIDHIFATNSFALPSPVENITYTGTANTASVGNSLANAMTGNSGNNYMEGRGSNDSLAGGDGIDTLVGGAGADDFVFREMGSANADRINEFLSATDSIALDDAVFSGIDVPGSFRAGAGLSSGLDANDRVVYDTSAGQLYYDADGSGGDAAQLIATLANAPGLSANDITVI